MQNSPHNVKFDFLWSEFDLTLTKYEYHQEKKQDCCALP